MAKFTLQALLQAVPVSVFPVTRSCEDPQGLRRKYASIQGILHWVQSVGVCWSLVTWL